MFGTLKFMKLSEELKEEIENTQVLIFAGGKAKRMGYLQTPKPLLKISNKPLIDYTVEMCAFCGFKDFVFLLGYKSEEIKNHIKGRWEEKINVKYSIEPERIKGKGKALKYALKNGKIDKKRRSLILFPDDLILDKTIPAQLLLAHLTGRKLFATEATATFVKGVTFPFGKGEINEFGLVEKFEEKPLLKIYTSTGLYVFEPHVYKLVEKKISLASSEPQEFESIILPILAKEKKLFSFVIPPNAWISVNTVKEYELAQKIFEKRIFHRQARN